MNDYEAFCAWIGSLFHEDGYRHQYIWLHGPGGDGKSTITNAFLEAFAGSAVTVRIPDHHTRRFFNSTIVGKRLAIFSDAESDDFTTSGHFKELTGDDFILVEEKYKAPYQAKNNCKFLFISNESPTVRNRESDRRRCIPISIDPPHGDLANMGPRFTKLVQSETPLFINFCLDMYETYMRDGVKPITLNEAAQEALQNHADDTDSLYEEIFHEHFRVEPSSMVRCSDLNARVRSCKANTKKFREWVEVRLGIDMTRIHDSKTDQKYHHGIKIIQAVIPS
jgi:phage/plasmid-associated DNA primase